MSVLPPSGHTKPHGLPYAAQTAADECDFTQDMQKCAAGVKPGSTLDDAADAYALAQSMGENPNYQNLGPAFTDFYGQFMTKFTDYLSSVDFNMQDPSKSTKNGRLDQDLEDLLNDPDQTSTYRTGNINNGLGGMTDRSNIQGTDWLSKDEINKRLDEFQRTLSRGSKSSTEDGHSTIAPIEPMEWTVPGHPDLKWHFVYTTDHKLYIKVTGPAEEMAQLAHVSGDAGKLNDLNDFVNQFE